MPQVLNNFEKPDVSACCCKGFDDKQLVMQTTVGISSDISANASLQQALPQKESSRIR